jgi:molecular chaperone HtpG
VAFVDVPSVLQTIGDEITIGKDVLELLTGAMYADPLAIYREYIQNAADAIDEGKASGVFQKPESGKVSISIDRGARSVTITDNGAGVPCESFVQRLTAIGGSQKRGADLRGFRGVGRLSGLGYCQEVIFRSRALGDKKVSEIHWDGRRLKEVLRDSGFAGGLVDVVKAVAKTNMRPGGDYPPHFFQVELRKVARVKNDILLNEEAIREYIGQVGPVGFDPTFSLGLDISRHLARFGAGEAFTIELNDGRGPIYRPFHDKIQVTEKQSDRLHSPEFFQVPGLHEGTAAVGWILHHSYFGAWPKRFGIGGIRTRVGNIQIGGADFFAPYFIESRFNQWCVGELHVVTNKLMPNGRRDDFEYSPHYENFLANISPRLNELTRLCRERSELRQRLKIANQHVQRARHSITALKARSATPIVRKVSEWQCVEALRGLDKTAKARELGEAERRLIANEHTRLNHELQKYVSRYSGRDPFRALSTAKRKDIEPIVRLVFERIRNQKKAEDLARRILQAFR